MGISTISFQKNLKWFLWEFPPILDGGWTQKLPSLLLASTQTPLRVHLSKTLHCALTLFHFCWQWGHFVGISSCIDHEIESFILYHHNQDKQCISQRLLCLRHFFHFYWQQGNFVGISIFLRLLNKDKAKHRSNCWKFGCHITHLWGLFACESQTLKP